jgi:CRISPR/Cas system CSM-associated protein Csm3 (group 7 of RAMP superfamily)
VVKLRDTSSVSVRNFDFVYFPENPNTNYLRNLRNRRGDYSGFITLKMTAVDNIYLGSGFVDFDARSGMIGTTIEELNRAVIPGSSIKGSVRQVARAISDGCIMQSEKERLYLTKEQRSSCVPMPKKNETFHVCVVCDMFGTMGLKSKLSFSDFTADDYEIIKCQVPLQFSPNIQAPFYKEDRLHKGYKFYFTECEKRESEKTETITAIKKDTVFTGRIAFDGLDKKEFLVFMHSLGIGGEYFSHKIGGYKADGFGTVNFECTDLVLNGEILAADKAVYYACEYIDNEEMCTDECHERIAQLREIMKYKK